MRAVFTVEPASERFGTVSLHVDSRGIFFYFLELTIKMPVVSLFRQLHEILSSALIFFATPCCKWCSGHCVNGLLLVISSTCSDMTEIVGNLGR